MWIKRKGFTLIELMLVISIISILASMLIPVIFRSREQSRRVTCMSNLRQIGVACHIYSSDWAERFPDPPGATTVTVCNLLIDNGYMENGQIFVCPSSHDDTKNDTPLDTSNISYFYVTGMTESEGSQDSPMWADQWTPGSNRWQLWDNHGFEGGCVVFVYGNVKWEGRSGWPGQYPVFSEV